MTGEPGRAETLEGELIQHRDLQGDLHTHTTYSDGTDDLWQIAKAALDIGYRYVAITDHAESEHVRSHSELTLLRQRAEIDDLNDQLAGRLTILQGVELDIGPDGLLADLGGLEYHLDLVIASIHSHFTLDRSAMTERVLTAMRRPFVKILGHPTARRQGIRPPVDMDLDAVFRAAAQNGVALEINATPTRLDLHEDHIRLARQYGCMFSIDTDSHAASGLSRVTLGVEMAQKAGLRPSEVINCLDIRTLQTLLGEG